MDFAHKGWALEAELKSMGQGNQAQVLFPLDCDEFICLDRGSQITCKPSQIRAYIASLMKGQIYKAKRRLNNAPWDFCIFLPMSKSRPGKVFMTTTKFCDLDAGSHSCQAEHAALDSEISYLHLHNKPYAWLQQSARDKLEGYGVDASDRQRLRSHKGKGWHLCRYILDTEEEWLKSLHRESKIRSCAFQKRLKKLKIRHPFADS